MPKRTVPEVVWRKNVGQQKSERVVQTLENIRLVENFLPDELFADVVSQLSRQKVTYGAKSNSKDDPFGHWSTHFVRGGKSNLASVQSTLETNEALASIGKAWAHVRERFLPNHVLIRCYMNAYTYGCDGYFHSDSHRVDDFTAILYLNEEWDPDWAGETSFLDANGDISTSVLPRRNRLVLFSGIARHAARGLSRKCPELRRVLVFKARRAQGDNYEDLSDFLVDIGATRIKHRKGALHDHLMRTYSLLKEHGERSELCLAGGLHSVFGTNRFKNIVLDGNNSSVIQEKFGGKVAQLVYLFSTLDRPKTLDESIAFLPSGATLRLSDGASVDVSAETLRDLCILECANLLDQGSLTRHPELMQLWGSSARSI